MDQVEKLVHDLCNSNKYKDVLSEQIVKNVIKIEQEKLHLGRKSEDMIIKFIRDEIKKEMYKK